MTDQRLPLTTTMFDKDAWVMKSLQSRSIILQEDNASNQVFEIEFNGFSNLVLWAAKDAPFICIEPCCGYNDSIDTTGQLEEKEGMVVLERKQSVMKSWSININ